MSIELLSKALRSSKVPGVAKRNYAQAAVKPKHGQEIYVYRHVQTKQVVYSLQKHLNNNQALGQIPFNGKKTVPATLRKDLWAPFAKIEFGATRGSISAGLIAFRKLREYRRLHELSWPESLALDKDGKPLTRKARGRLLCDQVANSVADMSAALESVTGKINGRFSILSETLTEEDLKKKRRVRLAMARKRASEEAGLGQESEEPTITATVKWANILDAEFAEKWPEHVVHDTLEPEKRKLWSRNAWRITRSTAQEGDASAKVLAEELSDPAPTELRV